MMRHYKHREEELQAWMAPVLGCYDSCLVMDHGNGMRRIAALYQFVGYLVVLEIWLGLRSVVLGSVRFEELEMELSSGLVLVLVLATLKVAVLSDQACYCFCFDNLHCL